MNGTPSPTWRSKAAVRYTTGAFFLLSLIFLPAPLLPPHRLAEGVQSLLGLQWKAAYLLAAVGMQILIFGGTGLLAGLTCVPSTSTRGRVLQVLLVPFLTVAVALVVRSLRLGFFPVWVNAAVPIATCFLGTVLGLLSRHRWIWLTFVVFGAGGALWLLMAPTELSRHTSAELERFSRFSVGHLSGDDRFLAILHMAFRDPEGSRNDRDAVRQNRAAIMALGIAIGDPRLARFAGLDPSNDLVQAATGALDGTTLRGRGDWPRHFWLSAALAVMEHPLVSDAAGLMKEQMDALTRGSGFSFGDLAADRAGIRLAEAATRTEEAARSFRDRVIAATDVNTLFPSAADLPENLSVEQFRRDYGGVGSARYREAVQRLESKLDSCALLVPSIP